MECGAVRDDERSRLDIGLCGPCQFPQHLLAAHDVRGSLPLGLGLHAYRQGRYRCNVRGSPDIPGAGRPRLLLAGGLVPSRDVRQEQGRTVERLHERLGAGGRHSGAAHHRRGSGQRQLGSAFLWVAGFSLMGAVLVAGTTRWSTDQAYHAKYPADGQAAITA